MSRRAFRPGRIAWMRRLASMRRLTFILCVWAAGFAGLETRAATREALQGVVQVNAQVPHNARTADALGTEREGTGVVIDGSGLVVTIGYLILEAIEVSIQGAGSEPVPAQVVGYDHETGFGLLRAAHPLDVKPIPLGRSAGVRATQPLMVVSRAGEFDAAGVYVVDRREFAGYWEYLLEDAIFTAPPHAKFGGAALIDQDGRLVGIGSLIVNDAGYRGRPIPGNMFVPIDQLKPILADLLSSGRRADPAKPWLGLFLEEHRGRLFVTRVAPGGPAEAAGLAANDLILGIDGASVQGLAEFYRQLWTRGPAGTEISLDVLQGQEVRPVVVKSADRYRWLRLNPTY